MDAAKRYSSRIEAWLDGVSQPVKPYIPAVARFLLIVTYLEDSLRIVSQWSDQLYYL